LQVMPMINAMIKKEGSWIPCLWQTIVNNVKMLITLPMMVCGLLNFQRMMSAFMF
jgi:hypothetical protein